MDSSTPGSIRPAPTRCRLTPTATTMPTPSRSREAPIPPMRAKSPLSCTVCPARVLSPSPTSTLRPRSHLPSRVRVGRFPGGSRCWGAWRRPEPASRSGASARDAKQAASRDNRGHCRGREAATSARAFLGHGPSVTAAAPQSPAVSTSTGGTLLVIDAVLDATGAQVSSWRPYFANGREPAGGFTCRGRRMAIAPGEILPHSADTPASERRLSRS